jgi:uroporphyrinogen-III synthase
MRLLVTRPQPQADAWVADLRQRGLDAHALPLIEISAPADPGPVQHTWQHLAAHRLLMFVSPAAAEWFFRLRPADAIWPNATLAATPGPGTARSLTQLGAAAGLQAAHIICPQEDAAQFDSEALWPLLSPLDWAGQRVAIVSGGDSQEAKGRQWLSAQLQTRGAQVASVLTYQRRPGQWTPAQQALARSALQAPGEHLWLFSSSQAIEHLASHHLPAMHLSAMPDWSQLQALATHPKIGDGAHQLGISQLTLTRPTLDAVAQAAAVVSARRSPGPDTPEGQSPQPGQSRSIQ